MSNFELRTRQLIKQFTGEDNPDLATRMMKNKSLMRNDEEKDLYNKILDIIKDDEEIGKEMIREHLEKNVFPYLFRENN